jgi:hypothetical protein
MGRGRKWRGGVKRDVACVTCVGALLYFFSVSVHGQCRLAAKRMKRIFHICDRGMLCRL